MSNYRNTQELESGLSIILNSPKEAGLIEMIVIRPEIDQRQIIEEAEITFTDGVVGDNWNVKPSSSTPNKTPHPEKQITVMNSRVIELIEPNRERWPMAGDQFFIDLDLSHDNLPAGTQIQLGTAVIEVTPPAHTGCKKFVERFGLDAMKFVNSSQGKELNLRGINAKVVQEGFVISSSMVQVLR